MHQRTPHRPLPVLILTLVLLCIPALSSFGRAQAGLPGNQLADVIPRAYMPLILVSSTSNNVTITFSASVSGGHIGTPQTTFPYGTTRIWYEAKFTSVKGQTYLEEWVVNGVHLVVFDITGTVESNDYTDVNYIDSGGDPSLACGTYVRKIYLNGQLATEASAYVQPQTEPCR